MNTIKITQAHYQKAWDDVLAPTMSAVDVCNKAIEIAMAEQQAQPEPVVAYVRPYNPNLYCTVAAKGDPAKRMLRTEAQELQRKLGDAVEWWAGTIKAINCEDFTFNLGSNTTYTYAPKATIKLDGKMVTPEQAATEWGAKKETHALWFRLFPLGFTKVEGVSKDMSSYFSYHKENVEFELRQKALKQVSWSDMPVGVAVRDKTTGVIWLYQGSENGNAVLTNHPSNPFGSRWIDLSELEIAAADKQTLIPVAAPDEGLTVEYSKFVECMKITGIAKGWELK
jgi:hypothetical protein